MSRDVIVIVHAYGGSPKKFWYPALCKHFESEAAVITAASTVAVERTVEQSPTQKIIMMIPPPIARAVV